MISTIFNKNLSLPSIKFFINLIFFIPKFRLTPSFNNFFHDFFSLFYNFLWVVKKSDKIMKIFNFLNFFDNFYDF